ncbi:hypothetical protein JCM19037_896 [Geomicrobium sp. JCM 19037]|uniref:S-layer homology domain-containing protein n=1 Tax=Geomicrobium sp. JCM 19037 TaxID=1460634 RepID=UPI00045F1888|nr:S-layer homology domain-containing protein [Geomicrobium sp. JCM 19037]GAK02647.1 hypothetical protein JCM19037_896 [Geomicrobium sp. JCM 19037]
MTESPFADVPASNVYADVATVMKETGIMVGQQNNTIFNAGEGLTREQMASVLVRAFDLESLGGNPEVIDLNDSSDVHRENILILTEHGITQTEDQRFRPREVVNRGQMALFIDRILTNVHVE